MEMSDKAPSMEAAYANLRPLFFGALATLARQGLIVSPSDGLDLIHDFFSDEWERVAEHFDPQKGGFEAYVYSAFIYFTRPRILRLLRYRHVLLAPEEMEQLPIASSGKEHITTEIDAAKVRNIIWSLPKEQRQLLTNYVYAEFPSERALARQYKLTRYRLRERLIEALGRVVILLGVPFTENERDSQVAVSLWRDQFTIAETSVRLAITKQEVTNASARNIKRIATMLRSFESVRSELGRDEMNQGLKEGLVSPEQLLREALLSANDSILLTQVKARAKEILIALDASEEAVGILPEQMEKIDPKWVAMIYEAIGTGAGAELEPIQNHPLVTEALIAFRAKNEWAVGRAFRDSLMSNLPPELQNFKVWFESVRPVDDETREFLCQTPAVVAGMPKSEQLIVYGVTPLTIYYASEAVPKLLSRYIDDEVIIGNSIEIKDNQLSASGPEGRIELTDVIVDEIERFAECDSDVSSGLFRWLIRVGMCKPYIFSGFRAHPKAWVHMRLIPTAETIDNLYLRWSKGDVPVAALTAS